MTIAYLITGFTRGYQDETLPGKILDYLKCTFSINYWECDNFEIHTEKINIPDSCSDAAIFYIASMTFYYDFEDRKMHAKVHWPVDDQTIQVELTDSRLIKEFPSDLIFEMNTGNRISYNIENKDNKRLSELQRIIAKRLQEFANYM